MKKYLIAILFLASCSNIPTAGPISPGIELDSSYLEIGTTTIPMAPRKGMSQQEVVAGFLAANASSIGDFTIAREYLAKSITYEWESTAGVQVFESDLALELTSETTVTAVGTAKLDLDDQLRPNLVAETSVRTIDFSLVEEDGNWRITNPPAGLVMPNTDFQRNYEIAKLWFVDREEKRLVPDFIAISQRNDPAAQLVRALTAGSSSWLKPAVTNFLDPIRSGGLAGVQRDGDRVTVDLEAKTLLLESREQSWLMSQLAQTLQAIIGINALKVTVGGQPINVPGVPNPVQLRKTDWVDKRITKVTNQYAISEVGQLIQPANKLLVPSWIDRFPNPALLAVAGDERQIAVALPERAEIAVGSRDKSPRFINQVAVVSDLNFDPNGNLWFLNRSNRGWFSFDGFQLRAVPVPIPVNSVLNHVMVGPDNIRVAIMSESDGIATLAIARLVSNNRSTTLENARPMFKIVGDVRGMSWYSNTEVVLLVKFSNQTELV